ncbi:MAG: diaminopimelate epimerase [Planctomycetota bacterium]|jgi:diaminopimelate epimerase
MRFVKMHGAGNDYVFVDTFEESVADAPSLARAVSDRHTGIGGDGLILLAPSESADCRMIMYNADGSRAEMCGNGLRCVARLARNRGRVASDLMRVETDAGIRVVQLTPDGARVDMGAPSFSPESIPVTLPGPRVVDQELEILDTRVSLTCVSMGNPHAVLYVDDVDRVDVSRIGPIVEMHDLFPERTNVEFVQVLDESHVRQRTWERGSGETLACGTGACAVCVAGVLTGRTGHSLRIRLRGGELLLEWDGEGSVLMTGPVVEVFRGEWASLGM